MPATYNLIASNTLTTTTATITFNNIPATYTDLVLRATTRITDALSAGSPMQVRLNNNTSAIYSTTQLRGSGSAGSSSSRYSNDVFTNGILSNGGSTTSSTFASIEIYIPSYANTTQNKVMSAISSTENNASTAFIDATAHLVRTTSAISRIDILDTNANNFVSGSSFFLYGIKNS